jgi:hypothetical protein
MAVYLRPSVFCATVTDVSGRHIGTTLKGKTVQDFDFSTLEDEIEVGSKTTNLPQRRKGVYI